jgi:hypothetical protein
MSEEPEAEPPKEQEPEPAPQPEEPSRPPLVLPHIPDFTYRRD